MYKCQWRARPHWCGFWSLLEKTGCFLFLFNFYIKTSFNFKLHNMYIHRYNTNIYIYKTKKAQWKISFLLLSPRHSNSVYLLPMLWVSYFLQKTNTLWIKKQKHRFLPFSHKQYHPIHTLCILFFFFPLNLTWKCSDKNTWGESSFFYTATLTIYSFYTALLYS